MSSDASLEGFSSPSTRSVNQVPNGANYYYETTPPLRMESDARQMAAPASVPRASTQSSSYQPQYPSQSYVNQSAMSSYYSTMQPSSAAQPQVSSLYYQRPLPQVCVSFLAFAAPTKKSCLTRRW